MRLFDDAGGGGNGWAGEPLIVDSFAGGGGASTGIEMALGRSPDIAINHNADALAMHEVNHPETLHLSKNIWQVDPLEAVGNRPVGLAWFSPDCKHFSKAKGGRPVKRSIRDLAWVVVLWARRVRPQVIMLENVEEFRDWGPVSADGKPCAERKGQTFAQWTGELRRLGYRLEFRELRGFNYGAPTIRKRFFMIARRDGRPIVWPKATHGRPDDPDVIAGRKKPWRTAAEIIDWSLPCPSIFETSAEIFEKHGVRAVRPLADATMRRIARGVVRYVLEAKKPFVVTFAQQGGGNRSPDDPLHTVTASPKDQNAIVVPSFVGCGGRAGESAPRGGDEPSRDAQARERRGGTQTAKADGCVVAAHLTKFQTGSTGSQLDEPAPTVTANSYVKRPGGAAPIGIVAASMQAISPRVGEMSDRTEGGAQAGSRPSVGFADISPTGGEITGAAIAPILVETAHGEVSPSGVMRWGTGIKPTDEPMGTGTISGNHAIAVPYLVPRYGERQEARSEATGRGTKGQEPRTRPVDRPAPVVVPDGNEGSLAAVHLTSYYGEGEGGIDRGRAPDGPLPTDTAGGNRHGVVAAFLAQHNNDSRRIGGVNPGRAADEPLATVTASGAQQQIVAAHMMRQFGTSIGHLIGEPAHTDTATVNKSALISAFLTKYYGTGDGAIVSDPLHTDTVKDRMGLVTVEIDGQTFAIADIGMRMLTPRERFRAQGFPDSYIIDRRADGTPITQTVQGSCCGNSVCPPLAEALVRANCGHLARREPVEGLEAAE